MKAVITIIGADKIGIVHKVTGLMEKFNLNIIDISQTVMDKYFTMVMLIDLSKSKEDFDQIVEAFDKLGKEIGMDIKIQHQDIFDAMHQI
ncbi:ACT domain-containing protein [Peptoniphilus obesi]|uniref:ACT domain-containing protein n=1 Tax=Peptoniphilus obesi TaxID=1472765 RepID=UPI0004B495CE|nr:ACT domain-containing protein [Peptoniphilus obesi]